MHLLPQRSPPKPCAKTRSRRSLTSAGAPSFPPAALNRGLDTVPALHDPPRSEISISNGQYQIRFETRPPDNRSLAPQPEGADAPAQNAEGRFGTRLETGSQGRAGDDFSDR